MKKKQEKLNEVELLTLFEKYKKCNTDSLRMIFDNYYDEFIGCAYDNLNDEIDFHPDNIVPILLKRFTKKELEKKKKFTIRSKRTVEGFFRTSIINLCREKENEFRIKTPFLISFHKLKTIRSDNNYDNKKQINYASLRKNHSSDVLLWLLKEACDVSKISETQYNLLRLSFHGFDNLKISNKLQISYANVTNSKTRAIRKLHGHIKKIESLIEQLA